MDKLLAKLKHLNNRQRLALGLVVVIAIVFLIAHSIPPERSVQAYCKVYAQEKSRLAKLPGDTYSSGVFHDSVGDAGEFATSFGRLERVAPKDISPDIASLKAVYKTMHDSPAQAITASLSGVAPESSAKQWTQSHCVMTR